ncbi:MAG: hypothetical protein UHI85_05655, partial [Turicibacter sp.]|nr:hypothetical protein [Turicibacter sp.]
MKRNYFIVLFIILITSIILGYFITHTERYKHYRQLQYLESVINTTLNETGYDINLKSNYQILGYMMDIEGKGSYSKDNNILYMNYLTKLNGSGVSPLTVELNQYIDNQDNIQYMNLNRGQWFQEPFNSSLTILDQIPEIFKNSRFKKSTQKIEILEDSENIQILIFELPLNQADFLVQQLIQNILNIADAINYDELMQEAPNVIYTVTLNKQLNQVTSIKADYTSGIQELLVKLMNHYPELFSLISKEEVKEMFFSTSIDISSSTSEVILPSGVKLNAVHISDLK